MLNRLIIRKQSKKALSTLGSSASLKPLKKTASNEKFAYSKDSSTASYLALLNTLKSSYTKAVRKAAQALLKTGKKQNQPDLQIAAMDLLMIIPSENKSKLMTYALKEVTQL